MSVDVRLLLIAAAFLLPLFFAERRHHRRAKEAAIMRQFAQTSEELEKNELTVRRSSPAVGPQRSLLPPPVRGTNVS